MNHKCVLAVCILLYFTVMLVLQMRISYFTYFCFIYKYQLSAPKICLTPNQLFDIYRTSFDLQSFIKFLNSFISPWVSISITGDYWPRLCRNCFVCGNWHICSHVNFLACLHIHNLSCQHRCPSASRLTSVAPLAIPRLG